MCSQHHSNLNQLQLRDTNLISMLQVVPYQIRFSLMGMFLKMYTDETAIRKYQLEKGSNKEGTKSGCGPTSFLLLLTYILW